jgi:hypothetical protein
MPVQQFPVSLYRPDHTGQHVLPTEEALDFRLDARPRAQAQLAQQLPIKAGVQPKTLGDGENHLPMRDGKTDLFGHVDGGQQAAFLVTGRAGGWRSFGTRRRWRSIPMTNASRVP